MAKLHIDVSGSQGLGGNWFGFSDQTTPTPHDYYLANPGEMVGGFFNPFFRPGYLSGSVGTLIEVTPGGFTIDAVPASAIYDPVNDDYYFAERGQHIMQGYDLNSATVSLAIDLGVTGTPVIHDLEIYQINAVRTFFFVYEIGGNLQVGISPLPYNTGTDNLTWLTGTVSGAFTLATTSSYNFMRTADNSYAYLFADNAVHKIDGTTAGGTNGTVTANVLLFPVDFRLYDAVDYRGNMFMVIHQTPIDMTAPYSSGNNFSNSCGVYIWNRQSTVVSMQDYVPVYGVRCIKKIYIASSGGIRIITISSDGLTQIRQYTGSTFEIIEELGLGAAPQYPDSLTIANQLAVWIASDGSIYAHGPVKKGSKDVLAKIGQVLAVSSSSPEITIIAGAILYGGATNNSRTGYRSSRQGFTVGYNDGTAPAYKLRKIYPFDEESPNNTAQFNLASNVYSSIVMLPPMTKVNYIRLYHKPTTTTGTTVQGTLSVFLNQSSTASITSSITRNDINKGWKYIPINQGAKNAVFAIQFKFVWPTNTVIFSTFSWLPRMIEIDYDVIEKKQ